MSELLADVPGVDVAYIYGSWAARHAGQPGPVPADLDVLVVGSADLDILADVERAARDRLRFEVNVQRVSADAWAQSDDPFLTQVRSQPLVELLTSERTA